MPNCTMIECYASLALAWWLAHDRQRTPFSAMIAYYEAIIQDTPLRRMKP